MERLKEIATDNVIEALRGAASNIRQDLGKRSYGPASEPYNYIWSDPDRCICGHFVNELLGETVKNFPSAWSELFEVERVSVCTKSGMTYGQIRDALAKRGFTNRMVSFLENGNHPAVLEKMGVPAIQTERPAHASEYLEAMASLLESLQENRPQTTETNVEALPA